jgi:hypothetical protein
LWRLCLGGEMKHQEEEEEEGILLGFLEWFVVDEW